MPEFLMPTKEEVTQQQRARADYASAMKRYGTPPSVWFERQEEREYSPAKDKGVLRWIRRDYWKWIKLPKQVAKEVAKSIKWLNENYPEPFSYRSKRRKGVGGLVSELAIAKSVVADIGGFLDGETAGERWKRYNKIPHDVLLLEKTKCDKCRQCGEVFFHRSHVGLTFCGPECEQRERVDRQRERRNADKPTEATCYHCGDTFKPQRSTARYCSPKCRVYANREKAKG